MKGKINIGGYLEIERGDRMQRQGCPFCGAKCGDWCPLFGEPIEYYEDDKFELDICKTCLVFTEFADERGIGKCPK